jgi:hypothetical protein
LAGKLKYRVIYRHVGFDLIDYDSLLVGRSLAPDLNRRWNEYASDLFIIAQVGLYLFVRAVSGPLC